MRKILELSEVCAWWEIAEWERHPTKIERLGNRSADVLAAKVKKCCRSFLGPVVGQA